MCQLQLVQISSSGQLCQIYLYSQIWRKGQLYLFWFSLKGRWIRVKKRRSCQISNKLQVFSEVQFSEVGVLDGVGDEMVIEVDLRVLPCEIESSQYLESFEWEEVNVKVKRIWNYHFRCWSGYDLFNLPWVAAEAVYQHFLLVVKRAGGESPNPYLSVD